MAMDFFSSNLGANASPNTGLFGFGATTSPTPAPAFAPNPYYGYGYPMGGVPKMESAPALYTAEDEALLRQTDKCDYQLSKVDLAQLCCDHRDRNTRQLLIIKNPTTQECECTLCRSKFYAPLSSETKETDSLQDIWNKFNCAKILNPGIIPIPVMQTVANAVGVCMKTLPAITEAIMKTVSRSYDNVFTAANAAISSSGYLGGYNAAASLQQSRLRAYNPQFNAYYQQQPAQTAPQYQFQGVQVPPYYGAPQAQPAYQPAAMPQQPAANIPGAMPGPMPQANPYAQVPQAGAYNPFGNAGIPQQPAYGMSGMLPAQPGVPNAFAVPTAPQQVYQQPAPVVDPNAAAVAANPAIPTPAMPSPAIPAPAAPAVPTAPADVNAGSIKP